MRKFYKCRISKSVFAILFLLSYIAFVFNSYVTESNNVPESDNGPAILLHQRDSNSKILNTKYNRSKPNLKKASVSIKKERRPQLTITKNTSAGYTSSSSSSNSNIDRPYNCTSEQKAKILKQLSPNQCVAEKNQPFEQQCSLTKATKCPMATWLTTYYQNFRRNKDEEFVAVYVGCNKGYDAVNALRMGTRNTRYNKKEWNKQFRETYESVCGQNNDLIEFNFPSGTSNDITDGYVHCIEPMAANHERLELSAKSLSWDDNFIVTKAALSKRNQRTYFRNAVHSTGRENWGLENNCEKLKNPRHPWHHAFKHVCEMINVYTLDHYAKTRVFPKNRPKKGREKIHILSIDVEGFDYDVILGGFETLRKTEYLEFEYNWMGSWATQKLSSAIKELDVAGFTCYWSGVDKLWRIDESCWLEHFDFHTWSNVACVNRAFGSSLVKIMEDIFLRTINDNITF